MGEPPGAPLDAPADAPRPDDRPPRTAGGEPLRSTAWLLRFYEPRGFEPAWSRDGRLLPRVDRLVRALGRAELEGLRPRDYHLRALQTLIGQLRHDADDPRKLADLDLLLSDAYLTYAGHLLSGRVDPETLDSQWRGDPEERDLAAHLAGALEEERVEESLRDLFFASHPGYFRLRSALAAYRALARRGGWPSLPAGDTLRAGDVDDAVAALRERLAVTGDLEEAAPEGSADFFDTGLEEAVRGFQRRHGLEPDGVVGPATVAALDVPAEERVRQIELNLERWRWLPQELGARYIVVNIAGFQVDVMEFIEPALRMRAIVGKRYTQTPVFSDTVRYLVLNPVWNVPRSIAIGEILPRAKRDPGYLRREGFRIVSGWGGDADPVDIDSIDWSAVRPSSFPYRIYQAPGPANALGLVKFMFPNEYDVYLHDTPDRRLFERTVREFSHGCIRIENPVELAEYLLAGSEGWTPERIRSVIASGRETTVRLPTPIPIHIQYWTAWTEADGTVHFHRDIYGRDEARAAALADLDGREEASAVGEGSPE